MAFALPYAQRERSQSRGRSVSSRSSSISSAHELTTNGDLPPVQRWNGQAREATDWNFLRRDPELWHPQGNCLIYLFERGASRRGPSFRIPYDFLLYSSCRPLIEQSMTAGLQTSLYHPGSTTPPSYDNLSDTLSHESSYCSIHLEAPPEMSRVERFHYHITSRNFFAWLVGAPLVGSDPVSALLDLKVRMDIWRDPGADNLGALFNYIQEQSYGDFEDLELQMGKRLGRELPVPGPLDARPLPYHNVGRTLEQQEAEMKRGRRKSISSIGQSIRSGGQLLRKKVSRTFSRTRAESQSRPPSSAEVGSATSTLRQDVHKIMQPTIRTRSPPRPVSQVPVVTQTESANLKKRESSLSRFARKRLSWAAGSPKPDDKPLDTDSGTTDPIPSGLAGALAASEPPVNEVAALPTLPAQSQDRGLPGRLPSRTRDYNSSTARPEVPTRSSRNSSSGDFCLVNQVVNARLSATPSASASGRQLPKVPICACCGRPRIDKSAKKPMDAEQRKHIARRSTGSEIVVPSYGYVVPGPSQLRGSSVQAYAGRYSSTHSFMSSSSSMARSPPELENSYTSDSGAASPVSRDGSVDMHLRGRQGYGERPRRISNPTLIGVNGTVSSSAGVDSTDDLYWQGGQPREQISGYEGINEQKVSEVKMGKKRRSADSSTLGYHQSTGADMIGMARGSGLNQFAALPGRAIGDLAA